MSGIPLRHVSIRVPWHDNAWDGTVCSHPAGNASCLALAEIRENKNDDLETERAGQSIDGRPQREWPACIGERATFMAPFEHTRTIAHPYASFSDEHTHITPATFRHPAFSSAVIPFRWMMRKEAGDIAERLDLDFDLEREPDEGWLGSANWVQDHDNQRAMLDAFFGALEPERSLCFFYAKQTPTDDDCDRVLIGAGRVTGVGPLVEYTYRAAMPLRSFVWDRAVEHSVRPVVEDGFLLPYHELLARAADGDDVDLRGCTARCPEDRRAEFSYAGEHVTHDGAIAALLRCRDAIERSERFVTAPTGVMLKWIDARLGELWKLRGPTPGLGAALTAFGVERGNLLAFELSSSLGENESPWPLLDGLMTGDQHVSDRAQDLLTRTNRDKWNAVKASKPERRALLELIARFELTDAQAKRMWVQEERQLAGIDLPDAELLANPYLLYERDRISPDPISVWTVDRGAFPPSAIRTEHPVPEPSNVDDPTDRRRVRALAIQALEDAGKEGHTLQPRAAVVMAVRGFALDPECPVDGDLLDVLEDGFAPWIRGEPMADGTAAYQLDRLGTAKDTIASFVVKRAAGKRHALSPDWEHVLGELLGSDGLDAGPEEAERELRGRKEKAAALAEVAEARFSVLVGPAGTGKTTILQALIRQPEVDAGDVLLLAPTGKARVRLETATKHEAKTLAQFLIALDRYDERTGAYLVTGGDKVQAGRTVIVDEASMLTEEMLASLIDALRGVDRFILVGDPRQLPPIGAGRPFFDIVEQLKPERIEGVFPRRAPGYAELTVHRRHKGDEPDDVQLARWFSGQPLRATDDAIVGKVEQGIASDRVRFVEWTTADELREVFLDALVEELKDVTSRDDVAGFERTLGAVESGGYRYFNRGNTAKAAEAWQVLTPVRGLTHGVRDLNRLVQTAFRADTLRFAREKAKLPKPAGDDQVVYGDKVINLRNHRRDRVYPDDDALKYIANGEIGVIVGQFKRKDANWKGRPSWVEIEFSSQEGYAYKFRPSEFGGEGGANLELAYAITVHKAQGSEFGLTFLVLPEASRVMSRELLYTALTRQRERIVILHQGPRGELWKYASDEYSEMKGRLTNLFVAPSLVQVGDRYLEARLIHRSGKGEPMRSKSEVIIAEQLAAADVEYEYEAKLVGTDGRLVLPDFTIVDDDSGLTYYWEHCGMLTDAGYAKKWEAKKAWYATQGILPHDEGGGEHGTLIVTVDDANGGISVPEIKQLIAEIF